MSNRFDACFVTWQTINTDKKLTGKQVHIDCKQSIQITLHSAEWWQMNIQRLQDVVSFFQRQTLEHAHHRLQQTHYVSYAQCTIVVTSVQLRRVTLQFHNPEQQDTAKDILLFLVQHSGIHSHCLFVIHHWHWLSSVHVWRLCYSAEHTKH